ncbi:TetR/AcrR family transcriptional regulator C-terminal domain-containing protein, partial [Streptomyces sp. SID3343]|uniref:TetR/AcrR family transcriptional regulator n=1 Tax=Streptomyces sp. SID3343 TaxID=2690260 RepID=UPI0013C13610
IAAGTGFTKMALYRHVPSRAALVALMVDTALGAPAAPLAPAARPFPGVPAGEWRERLAGWARAMLAVLREHPWLLAAMPGHRVLGPNETDWIESALVALADTGLAGDEQLDAVFLVVGHVRNVAQQSVSSPTAYRDEPEELMSSMVAGATGEHADRYPALTAAVGSAEGARDNALAFGLDRILDGLELLIDRRREGSAT